MRTIYKYAMKWHDTITLPKGAKIVAFRTVSNSPLIWAEVDTEAETERREFVVRGTGFPLDPDEHYVGTDYFSDHPYVWHLFERKGM